MSTQEKKAAFDRAVDAACERLNNLHGIGKRHYRRDMVAVVAAVAPILRQDAAVAELIEAVGRGTPTVSHSPHGPALIFPAAEAAALRAAVARVGGSA